MKSIRLTAPNNVQQISKIILFQLLFTLLKSIGIITCLQDVKVVSNPIDKIETQSENKEESAQPHAIQVGIRMQQGEHTGQPIYANFTAVQGGQGLVFVDFGFLEPQAMQTLARMTQLGEKAPETIGARMSSRMAISVDAAANLARQLNQLLQPKAAKAVDTALSQEDVTLQ